MLERSDSKKWQFRSPRPGLSVYLEARGAPMKNFAVRLAVAITILVLLVIFGPR